MATPRFAFVTLCTSDAYLPGALVTLHSLLDTEPASPLQREWATVALTTPSTVGHSTVQALTKAFDVVIGVESIVTQSWEELKLLGRRDLAATLTKLHLFRLTQYEKVIFLDADTLVVRPIAHLFNLPHPFAAAPDQGWPDAFNSGVLVATPGLETFDALMDMMRNRGTWDGGDQGLLNDFFPDWHRLSFTYNVTPSAYYTYAPAYKRHGQDVSVLHFIGAEKPWKRGSRAVYDPEAASKDYYGLVGRWYDVFERHYGTISTYDVASRVTVPPKSFLQKKFSSLPLLPAHSKPSLVPPPQQSLHADEPAPSQPMTSAQAAPSSTAPVAIPTSSRASSPPQLTWDPARSSPPRGGPLQMRDAIPSTTNMWDDDVPLSQQRARFEPPSAYPPPPSETHDWYKDVMRTKPDPSKIRPVFPWEQPAPTSPSSSSGTGLVPPPAPTRTFSDEPAATGVPPPRFTGVSNFSNAWDTVPGIARYAQQLAKRHGHSRKSSGSGTPTASGSPGTSTGSSATGSAGSGAGERRPAHRRSRSGSSATVVGVSGRTPRAKEPSGTVGEAVRPGALYSKDGDASSRDGDDEDDDDAEVSTSSAATTGERDDDDEGRDSDDDSEGIDRITIRFRRALSAGELDPTNLQRGKKSGSPSSNEGNEGTETPSYYAGAGALPPKSPRDAPIVPASPTKTRRDSRYVPTSPRQPRSPQLSGASASLPFPGAPVAAGTASGAIPPRPPLRLQMPTTPGGTALSPRLAAQALRNSTAARLTASGSGGGDGPPVVRATRVFSPDTDTGVVKQQGLAALQRFVENMETMQQQQPHMQGGGGAGSGGAFMW